MQKKQIKKSAKKQAKKHDARIERVVKNSRRTGVVMETKNEK